MSDVKATFTISAENLALFAGIPRLQEPDKGGADQRTRQPRNSSDTWAPSVDQLVARAQDPALLVDDDLIAPSTATISAQRRSVGPCAIKGTPAPTRIMPTGDGGIAFQYDGHPDFISLEVKPEGPVELLVLTKAD